MTSPAEYSEGNVPIFRPTYKQFKDFYKYMESINSHGMKSGIVKIIPPQEWLDSLPTISEKIPTVKIKNPIVQHIHGQKGVYFLENIERQRTYTLPEWKLLAEMQNHRPPVPRGEQRKKSIDKASRRKSVEENKKGEKEDQTFDYNIDASEYTKDRCEFLENNYWKTLLYAEPMYGADCLGSIFDESVSSWNVAKLPNMLDYLDEQIPGVNEAYLYAGLWKASFAWHLEDQDLYSINYLHFGAPKQWYSIPQDQAARFYEVIKDQFPEEHKLCREFLRHKTFMASPSFLENKGVRVNKVVHYQQEFIVTYPFGYHSGFNYDYNLAESVNFALEEWLQYGLESKKCECVSDSVGIDVARLINNITKAGKKLLITSKHVPKEEKPHQATKKINTPKLAKSKSLPKKDKVTKVPKQDSTKKKPRKHQEFIFRQYIPNGIEPKPVPKITEKNTPEGFQGIQTMNKNWLEQ